MKSEVYESFGRDLLRGKFNLEGDVIMGMLVMGYFPDVVRHSVRSDVASEVHGSGYMSGGAVLCGQSVARDKAMRHPVFTASPLVWPKVTVEATGVVLYKANGNTRSDELIAYVDFGNPIRSMNGEFKVLWNKTGILALCLS